MVKISVIVFSCRCCFCRSACLCAPGEERQRSGLQPAGGRRLQPGEQTHYGAEDLSRWVHLKTKKKGPRCSSSKASALASGGPAGQVFPGDEVLEIGGVSTTGLRRIEAWNLIRKLPAGPADLVLRRLHQDTWWGASWGVSEAWRFAVHRWTRKWTRLLDRNGHFNPDVMLNVSTVNNSRTTIFVIQCTYSILKRTCL